jgi:integrase
VVQPKSRRERNAGGLFQKTGYWTDKTTGDKTPYTYWQATKDIPKEDLPAGVDRKRITGSGKTKSEAQQHRDANVAKFYKEPAQPPGFANRRKKPGRQTVTQWFNEWHAAREFTDLSDIMWKKYEGLFRLHILPHIGAVYLHQLDGTTLKLLFNISLPAKRKMRNGEPTAEPLLSSSARLNIYKALAVCLNRAVKEERISSSPLTLLQAPKLIKPNDDVDARAEDARELMRRLRDNKHEDYCRFLLQFLGLRRSERLGLEWSKIKKLDTDEAILVVSQQMARHADGRGWYLKKSTKTGRDREIFIPEPFLTALREHKLRQDEQRKSAEWKPEAKFKDLVFLHQDGSHITANRDNSDWKKLLQSEGFNYWRAHLNRHITATWLGSQSPAVPMGTVRLILGHDSEAINYYYTRSNRAQQEEPMKRYGDSIYGPQPVKNQTSEEV